MSVCQVQELLIHEDFQSGVVLKVWEKCTKYQNKNQEKKSK